MPDVVERYLTLGLTLGRHVDGFVDICSRYAADDPARFRTLLTEQVRVADLVAA